MTRRYRFLSGAASGLLFAVTALAAPAPPLTWPESPASLVAKAYFAMLADGSENAIRTFETTYRSSSAMAQVPMEERIRRIHELRFRFSALTPVRAETIDPAHLRVVASAGEANVELEFEMDGHDPTKLAGIAIRVAGHGGTLAHNPITPEARDRVVEEAAKAVADNYVYPAKGQAIAEALRRNQAHGDYAGITDDGKLAQRLTEDLRSVNHDLHLSVGVEPPEAEASTPGSDPDQDGARENFGFRRVELLDGNIGLVRLDSFMEGPEAMQTADAAMAFLKHADALIFDLRWNHGGDPVMIQRLAGYLFGKRTHLNSMVDRAGAVVDDFWTGDVPGTRFRADLPVYVLTSSETFSCAEEFTYDLKNLRRATIVGETTGGGAHPVMDVQVGGRFVVMVPHLRALNPVTKTDWEGVGVEPDVKTTADAALDRALVLARAAARPAEKPGPGA
jgi:hypothetical protein